MDEYKKYIHAMQLMGEAVTIMPSPMSTQTVVDRLKAGDYIVHADADRSLRQLSVSMQSDLLGNFLHIGGIVCFPPGEYLWLDSVHHTGAVPTPIYKYIYLNPITGTTGEITTHNIKSYFGGAFTKLVTLENNL